MASHTIPQTHCALIVISTASPPTLQTLPMLKSGPGSAVVCILAANVISYMRQIYNGERQYHFPTPPIPGASVIGRIATVGPDATLLKPGMLVFEDCTIRGRDDATAVFLSGIHGGNSEVSETLIRGEWKDSIYAEYAKVPLETREILGETKLFGKMGYEIADPADIAALLVPYGGLRANDLKAGETVIVSPRLGLYGGAAVLVALAMGASVIAMGRNMEALERIKKRSERIETVPVPGDVLKDSKALRSSGAVDAFFDISLFEAGKSTHIKSGILALKRRLTSLVGHLQPRTKPFVGFMLSENTLVSHVPAVLHRSLTLKGKWMFEREDIKSMIKMVESGVLKLGESAGLRVAGTSGLEDWDKGFTAAEKNAGLGKSTVITP